MSATLCFLPDGTVRGLYTGSSTSKRWVSSRWNGPPQSSSTTPGRSGVCSIPTDLSVMLVLNQTVPLSKLMGEQVAGLRTWAKGRARPATKQATETTGRRILASA